MRVELAHTSHEQRPGDPAEEAEHVGVDPAPLRPDLIPKETHGLPATRQRALPIVTVPTRLTHHEDVPLRCRN